ncbi:Uncharacterised protein g5672 [Pycnogonum litorale]
MGCNTSSNQAHGPTKKQLRLVQKTWQHILAHRKQAAIILIQRLISSDEQIRRVFERFLYNGGDGGQALWNMQEIQKHGMLLIETIDLALNGLEDTKNLFQILFELGERHASYGVTEGMFPVKF